tara:strand:- start:341 stop:1447 length:1107 start_codon:yes stop_codon:yes gene_type:complete
MPKTGYPGKRWQQLYYNVGRTEVSFKELCDHPIIKKLIKPPHQGALHDEKIDGMIEEYNTNPSYWSHKQIIVVAEFNSNYFITDGQHRIEAGQKLFTDYNKNDVVLVNWYTVNNEDELRDLYNSVNHDSAKNSLFIEQELITKCRSENFVRFMKVNYKSLFPSKMTDTNKRFPIELLRDELSKRKFFEREKHQELEIFSDMDQNESYEQYILRSNTEFYKLYNYDKYIKENQLEHLFYRDEIKFIEDKLVFMLRNTNFLDWIMNKTMDPSHDTKNIRKKIPQSVRNKVWKAEFGTAQSGVCPITGCDKLLHMKGTDFPWHCGHKISAAKEGPDTVDNLRPICPSCNFDMGKENWDVYEARVQPYYSIQ